MNLSEHEETSLRSMVHDMNGQIFLIRGHCEIIKRSQDENQLAKSIDQIQAGSDELERLVRKLRQQCGFPKV